MSKYTISGSIMDGSGKKGIILPDENGYYPTVMGGLNTYNGAGEWYRAGEALEAFDAASSLQRRIKKSALGNELGHPRKQPGMTQDDYYDRLFAIEESNCCSLTSKIVLDLEYGQKNPDKTNRETIAIIGWVIPWGPHKQVVIDAINNPLQSFAYSIRCFTENRRMNGRTEKTVSIPVTFDFVLEPGIAIANRHTNPNLESYGNSAILNERVDPEMLKCALERAINQGLGLESSHREFLEDTIKELVSKTHRKIEVGRKIFM